MPVVVVTDSSSRLQSDELKEFDIRQVPLHVLVDGTDLRDGVDDLPYDIHDRPRVTTAGATPAELDETYRQALSDSDGDGVVAVHLSAALSSTYSSAVQAGRKLGSAVRVVNSRSAAMGVGVDLGVLPRWNGLSVQHRPESLFAHRRQLVHPGRVHRPGGFLPAADAGTTREGEPGGARRAFPPRGRGTRRRSRKSSRIGWACRSIGCAW